MIEYGIRISESHNSNVKDGYEIKTVISRIFLEETASIHSKEKRIRFGYLIYYNTDKECHEMLIQIDNKATKQELFDKLKFAFALETSEGSPSNYMIEAFGTAIGNSVTLNGLTANIREYRDVFEHFLGEFDSSSIEKLERDLYKITSKDRSCYTIDKGSSVNVSPLESPTNIIGTILVKEPYEDKENYVTSRLYDIRSFAVAEQDLWLYDQIEALLRNILFRKVE